MHPTIHSYFKILQPVWSLTATKAFIILQPRRTAVSQLLQCQWIWRQICWLNAIPRNMHQTVWATCACACCVCRGLAHNNRLEIILLRRIRSSYSARRPFSERMLFFFRFFFFLAEWAHRERDDGRKGVGEKTQSDGHLKEECKGTENVQEKQKWLWRCQAGLVSSLHLAF